VIEVFSLSEEAIEKIDREVAKYPEERKSSAVMAALAIAQHEIGWVSKDVVEFVAAHLGMRSIAVWEVATFYGMYNLEKPGKYKIAICTNLPCALQGSNDAAALFKSELGIDFNQTTDDGLVTLKEAECMGACGDAPVVIVNDREMRTTVCGSKVADLLAELRKR
jgi:NADH-quinone oxidoreductase subunit E